MALQSLHLTHLSVPADQYLVDVAKYDLSPPYQRASVWTDTQRANLLKSLFMGLPIGVVVINFRGYDSPTLYAVVDGKQRIETLRRFAADGFALPTDWFDPADVRTAVVSPLTGEPTVLFSGLSPRLQRKVENFPIATLRSEVATLAEEAALFDLINSSGTPQSTTDLARARDIARG